MAEAQSLTGQAGIVAGQDVLAMEPDSPFINAMAHFPTATQTMSWNALRGTETMLGGGFAPNSTAGMAQNHLNPRSWGRFSGNDVFNQSNATLSPFKGEKGSYSMFNFMSRGSNSIISRAANNSKTGGMTNRFLARHGFEATEFGTGARSNVGHYISPGSYTNMVASRKLSGLSDAKFAKAKPNVLNYIKSSDSKFFDAAETAAKKYNIPGGLGGASKAELADIQSMVPRGSISGRVAGYQKGLTGLTNLGKEAMTTGGREAFQSGLASAQQHLGLGGFQTGDKMGVKNIGKGMKTAWRGEGASKLASKSTQGIFGAADDVIKGVAKATKTLGRVGRVARFGGTVAARYGSAFFAGPAFPAIMTAMMVVDLVRMGGSLAAGAAKFGKDAAVSLKGTIDAPIMGMGFKDNAVAATSRQRGVMAIQNSKLNARSVLGSEAASMHAAFG